MDGLGPVVSPGWCAARHVFSAARIGWLLDRPLNRYGVTWRRQAGSRATLQLHDVPI
jgi:hypothetical protein